MGGSERVAARLCELETQAAAAVRLSVCGVVRTEAVIKGEKKLHGLRWGLLVVGRVAGGDWCQC